jgi:two-component system phosphate regulon sensor histidine kinase PhoR
VRTKKYIPFLITIALLALIGLQVLWLVSVYKYKARELRDKTQDALLEATVRLQKEEDTKLILTNMDSLLITDTMIHNKTKQGMQLVVSTIKKKMFSSASAEAITQQDIKVINDTASSTTVMRIAEDGDKKTIAIHTSDHDPDRVGEKAGELQQIFLKMALGVKDVADIYKKIDLKHLQDLAKEELLNRGIDLEPEMIVMPTFKGLYKKKFIPLSTSNWENAVSIACIPLFPDNFTDLNLSVNIGYISKGSFVLKQMSGLLALSVIITILVGFVMIYIFRRMLSQEKLHQMKSDFINNMTHELKTPIATISLAIDSINNPIVFRNEEKLKDYTAIIKEENKKLDQHVERVLQMALLEKGEMMLEKKNVNLNSIINNSIRSNQLKILAINADVWFVATVDKAEIKGDEFALSNALSNLIDNALKYSSDPCKIEIGLTKENENYMIAVKDNGIGMEQSELNSIFDKFYRVQRGNLHDVKGSGLGLSYVKNIIELHNGQISVESEPGKGSAFTIKLKANANEDTLS